MSAENHVQFAEGIRKQQLSYAPDQINAAAGVRTPEQLASVPVRAPGVMSEQFPTDHLTSYSEADRANVAKLQLGEGSERGYTPFGKLVATDENFKWYQAKQAAAEEANFQQWFAQSFDLMSPAQKAWAKSKYPEFYAQRKKLLKQQSKNAFDLARIKLEGVTDFTDLRKQYLAETGRLDMGPLNHLINPEGVNAGGVANSRTKNQKVFQRGLANPFRAFGKEAYPADVTTRLQQSKGFENRQTSEWGAYKLGTDGVGFPAFAGTGTDQGDEDWFKMLRSTTQ